MGAVRLLLDTHVFLWRLLGDPRLTANAEARVDDLSNQLFLSSVSGFEVATKVAVGKLKLPLDVAPFVDSGMARNQINPLPLMLRHAYGVASLPLYHRDPFDRLLIATALEEGLTLLTDDMEIRKYSVPTIW